MSYVNWFWSFIDGLCLFAMMFVTGRGPTPVLLIGMIVWPVMVSAFMFWLGGKVWQVPDRRKRWAAVVLLLASSFLVVNLDRLGQPPFDVVPTYWSLMSVIY